MKQLARRSTRLALSLSILSLICYLQSPIANCQAATLDRITTTITFTIQPSDGNTVTYNGVVRTFKATVATPSDQILIGSAAAGTATNYYHQVAANPYTGGVVVRQTATNVVQLVGAVGQAVTASISGIWGTVGFSTQAVTTATTVRVPMAAEPTASVRTNTANQLIDDLGTYATTAFPSTSAPVANLVNIDQTQTITGDKTFLSITTSNLVNEGSAITSPGAGSGSERFGTNAVAAGSAATALGKNANAGGASSVAVGQATASGSSAVAMGPSAQATATSAIALGSSALASAASAISIGASSSNSHPNSVAIGAGAFTTSDNQIVLGTSAETVSIPGKLTGTIDASTMTNGTWRGQTTATSDLSFTRANITTLANGNNAAVNFGSETVYAKIKPGPTAAFAINGIAGGRNGRILVIENATGQAMTIAYDSGVDGTAANRIRTMTGADVILSGLAICELIYDSELSRWKLGATTEASAAGTGISGTAGKVPYYDTSATLADSQLQIETDKSVTARYQAASTLPSRLTLMKQGRLGDIDGTPQFGAGLGEVDFGAYDGTGDVPFVYILATAREDITSSAHGTELAFWVTKDGQAAPSRVMTLASDAARVDVYPSGLGGAVARVGGTIKVDTTSSGNVGAGEDNLTLYQVTAAALNVDGDYLEGTVFGTFAANANTKRIRIYCGSTAILDTTALAFNGAHWSARFTIIRTGAATQKAECVFTSSSALLTTTAAYSTPAETLSSPLNIKCTGEATSNNDIVQQGLVLKWMPNK